MDTIIMKTDEAGAIEKASEILNAGGLVAFPTETVYGLGGNALDASASSRIYAAKGRPSDNPLIVHIADTKDVYKLAEEVPEMAETLMEAFWPGPLTIIFKKKALVPDTTTGGLPTVAIRMPSHPGAYELIRESGIYIAAPSANLSGKPSPTTAQHVIEDMSGRIDMILDGGAVGLGLESTIVDVTGDHPVILRPGFITKKMLEELIGPVEIDPALIKPDKNLRPKAPGMKYTHYAPSGDLAIVESASGTANDAVVNKINVLAREALESGKSVAILTTKEHRDSYGVSLSNDNRSDGQEGCLKSAQVILLGSRSEGATVASRLYAALRECDEKGIEVIYCESFRDNELSGAIMNRLLRAAGHKVITV